MDPQIVFFSITHRVPLSAWHELAKYPCFAGGWRKLRAKAKEVIWEMRGLAADRRLGNRRLAVLAERTSNDVVKQIICNRIAMPAVEP